MKLLLFTYAKVSGLMSDVPILIQLLILQSVVGLIRFGTAGNGKPGCQGTYAYRQGHLRIS